MKYQLLYRIVLAQLISKASKTIAVSIYKYLIMHVVTVARLREL